MREFELLAESILLILSALSAISRAAAPDLPQTAMRSLSGTKGLQTGHVS